MSTKFPLKRTDFPIDLKARELQLGDVVQLADGAFMTAVVEKIEGNLLFFFRPYAITSDFSYGPGEGKIIPYIGAEHFSVMRDGSSDYHVLSRKELSHKEVK
jgi:hypothetical protein